MKEGIRPDTSPTIYWTVQKKMVSTDEASSAIKHCWKLNLLNPFDIYKDFPIFSLIFPCLVMFIWGTFQPCRAISVSPIGPIGLLHVVLHALTQHVDDTCENPRLQVLYQPQKLPNLQTYISKYSFIWTLWYDSWINKYIYIYVFLLLSAAGSALSQTGFSLVGNGGIR